jgi:hypothetical protein
MSRAALLTGAQHFAPPPGVVAWAVFTSPDARPALKFDRADADDYASRMHGVVYPLCVCKRRDDASSHQPE